MVGIRRRELITLCGSLAAANPLVVGAQQQSPLPVVGFINDNTADGSAPFGSAFRKGLGETGYIDGQNVRVEYHWLAGQFDTLPALVADLVRRRVAVIAAPLAPAAIAAKAATATIPIVFGVAQNPVQLGLVASLARPGGNATGVNFLTQEINSKRLALLHELVPSAARVAVLVNPLQTENTEATLRQLRAAAPVLKVQLQVLDATTIGGIDEAFAALARGRADALFVAGDGFFAGRRVPATALLLLHRPNRACASWQFPARCRIVPSHQRLSPRRNPHSPRHHRRPHPAISCLGAFRTPATGACGTDRRISIEDATAEVAGGRPTKVT